MHASMKSLIVLSCLSLSALALPSYTPYQAYEEQDRYYHGPPAPLAQDGRVIDTPEVAHAKQAHLAAYAAEAAKATAHHDEYSEDESSDNNNYVGYHNVYHGPPAPLGHDGRVIDTPEVAHAKAAHLAAYAEEISKVAHLAPYSHAKW